MFFTRDGKAIHVSHLVGPASLLKSLGMNYSNLFRLFDAGPAACLRSWG